MKSFSSLFPIKTIAALLLPTSIVVHSATARADFESRGYLLQFEEHAVSDESVAISVHTSSSFDHQATTRDAAIALNDFVRSNGVGMKSISLVNGIRDGIAERNHYLPLDQVDIPIHSTHGSHKLLFPNLSTAIFSGGYLNICLRNGFRDVLNYTKFSANSAHFYFVTDAIYISDMTIPNVDQARRKKIDEESFEFRQFPLATLVRHLTDTEIADYLSSNLIGYRDGRLLIGGVRVRNDSIPIGARLNFYRYDREIATFGDGEFEVNIILTTLEELMSRQVL